MLISRVKPKATRRRLIRMALGCPEDHPPFRDGPGPMELVADLVEALPERQLLPPGEGHDDPPTVGGPLVREEALWPSD